jgi:hypothetical protein
VTRLALALVLGACASSVPAPPAVIPPDAAATGSDVLGADLPAAPDANVPVDVAPTAIALDACHVYWTDEQAGTVMKLAR